MNDCSRGDLRDVLPDLVNDRLDPRTRAEVEQHLTTCANCAREVELLRDLRGVLARTPAVDVARIAAAVQASRTSGAPVVPIASRASPMRATWTRLAAGIALVLGGATGLLLWNRGQDETRPARTAVIPDSRPVDSVATPAVQPGRALAVEGRTPPQTEAPRLAATDGIVFGGGVGDLALADLEALIGDLERVDAITDLEPQPVLLDMEDGL
jgi:anti-sigma factor RsiW